MSGLYLWYWHLVKRYHNGGKRTKVAPLPPQTKIPHPVSSSSSGALDLFSHALPCESAFGHCDFTLPVHMCHFQPGLQLEVAA